MAFGGTKGVLGFNGTWATSVNLTGSVAVAVGDLVVVAMGRAATITGVGSAVSDNLGNTYTAQNVGTSTTSTIIGGKAFYARVTVAGTLTTITVTSSVSTGSSAAVAKVIEGPFKTSPLDKNVANTTDTATPFVGTATGTLTQADEVIVNWGVANYGTVWTAGTGFTIDSAERANSTTFKAVIQHDVVTATTTITPQFTAAASPTRAVEGVMTFMKAPSTVGGNVFTPSADPLVAGTVDSSFTGYTARQILPAAMLTNASAGQQWITFKLGIVLVGTGVTATVRVGRIATDGSGVPDFLSAPTLVTWASSSTLSVNPGLTPTEFISDAVTFNYDGTHDLVVSIEMSGGSSGGYSFETATTGANDFYLSGTSGSTLSSLGYTNYGQKNPISSVVGTSGALATDTDITVPQGNLVFEETAPTVTVVDPLAPFVRSVNKKVYATQINTIVPAPASIVAGDALVVIFTEGTSLPTITPPAGFTLQQITGIAQDGSAFQTRNFVYTKLATGSEPSTYTFTHTSAPTEATILAVGNAHTAITNYTSNVTNASGSMATAIGLDTNQNGALVFFVSQNWGDATTQMTPPSGSTPTFTEWMDAPNTALQYVAAGNLATRGRTGDKTQIVNSTAGNPSVGIMFEMDKATNVVEFTRTLTATYPHVEGYTMRMRIEPYRLVGMTAGTSALAISFLFGAATSGNIASAYVGHAAATGDGYDFDGSQAQLTFAGSGSVAVSGAQTKTSDAATFAFDPTKALIISAAFSGTRVDLAAFGG